MAFEYVAKDKEPGKNGTGRRAPGGPDRAESERRSGARLNGDLERLWQDDAHRDL